MNPEQTAKAGARLGVRDDPPGRLPILVSYQNTCVFAAVPKRKGRGYLKVPCGHRYEPWIYEAEEAAGGGVDITGWDGWLEIEHPGGADGRAIFRSMLPVLLREFRATEAEECALGRVLDAHKVT